MTLIDQIQAIREERDSLRLQLRTERAERMTVADELASLRARVTEYLAAVANYDRRNAFDLDAARACDAALDRVRAEVNRG